jgi:Survival motor neuron (SMN) interacting protein 1 (SIP1)
MECSICSPFGICLSFFNKILHIKIVSRRDARQLPDVVRVSNPYEDPEPPSTAMAVINTTIQSCLPSEEWRELFDFRFQNFRKVCYFHCKLFPGL